MQDEPTLRQIDDYDNNESQEKRNTVRLVIFGLVVMAIVYGFIKYNFSSTDEYIGTPENPGITQIKS